MMNSFFDEKQYFEAYIKTSQYLTTLMTNEDIWTELGKNLGIFFKADLYTFFERKHDGELVEHQISANAK